MLHDIIDHRTRKLANCMRPLSAALWKDARIRAAWTITADCLVELDTHKAHLATHAAAELEASLLGTRPPARALPP